MSLNIKGKKNIAFLVCLIILMVAVILGIVIGFFVYNFSSVDNEQQISELNTLYEAEIQNEEEKDTMLLVPLDGNLLQNEGDTNQGENKNVVTEQPKVVDAPYYIKVNNQANVVTIYKKDSKGKYTVPIKTMICSIGIATPNTGTYTISDKYSWRLLERERVWSVCN